MLQPISTLFPYTTLFRSPNGFELSEGFHQFRTKHFGEQLGARLAVSVFSRERPSVADHQVGCLLHERAELANARFASSRSEEHTSELQSRVDLVCRLLLE